MIKNGFTSIGLLTSVAVISCMAVIAVPLYQSSVAKAQIAEAENMINAEIIYAIQNMQKGSCISDGASGDRKGKFGSLKTSGVYAAKSGSSCDSGCDLTYTFTANTHKEIAGKKIVINLHNNGKTSVDPSSTISTKLIPRGLDKISEPLTGDSCSTISFTTPKHTAGSVTGSETGEAAPSAPAPSTPGGGGTGTTPPVGGTTPPGGSGGSSTVPTTPPKLTPQEEALAAKAQINTYTATISFDNGMYYWVNFTSLLTLKSTATDEQKDLSNWTVEIPPTTDIYGNTVQGIYKGQVAGKYYRFIGREYPVYTNYGWDGDPYYLPLILKYKGVAVITSKPTAQNIGAGTWG